MKVMFVVLSTGLGFFVGQFYHLSERMNGPNQSLPDEIDGVLLRGCIGSGAGLVLSIVLVALMQKRKGDNRQEHAEKVDKSESIQ